MRKYPICTICLILFLLSFTSCISETSALEDKLENPPEWEIEGAVSEPLTYLDIVYTCAPTGEGEKELCLDLYLPGNTKPPYPTIIYIHGGGWLEGDKETKLGKIMNEHGFALASINYRLSHEAIFPAQIHDVKAAVRWLRANAELYQLDPEHFGAWGHSAGGHLAALLGTSGGVAELEGELGNNNYSSLVQAVCNFSGPTDFNTVAAPFPTSEAYPPYPLSFFQKYGEDLWFEYSLATSQLLGGPPAELQELARMANPLAHITHNTPPFMVSHGIIDDIVPVEQSDLLVEALGRQGIETRYFRLEGMGHHLGTPEFPVTPELMEEVIYFFNAYLKR